MLTKIQKHASTQWSYAIAWRISGEKRRRNKETQRKEGHEWQTIADGKCWHTSAHRRENHTKAWKGFKGKLDNSQHLLRCHAHHLFCICFNEHTKLANVLRFLLLGVCSMQYATFHESRQTIAALTCTNTFYLNFLNIATFLFHDKQTECPECPECPECSKHQNRSKYSECHERPQCTKSPEYP